MKKMGVFAAVFAAALLWAWAASAEMYVEGYIGPTWSSDIGQAFTVNDVLIQPNNLQVLNHHLQYGGKTDVTVLGGLKLGTWFVKEGFLGYSGYPDWTKYLGFYTDFSFQRLYVRNQRLSGTQTNINQSAGNHYTPGSTDQNTEIGNIQADGDVITWAFMFAGRYGFFPDSEVPFGRLQPYVAVGPAVMWSTLKPKLNTDQVWTTNPSGLPGTQLSGNNATATTVALAVEGGVRYMALKNVSFDLSFKYRYAQPSYHFNGIDFSAVVPGYVSQPASYKLNPVYQLFSFQAGVAYHF